MSTRDRMLLRVAAPLAVLAVLWLMILSPKLDEMKSANSDVAEARTALVAANATLAETRTNRAAIRLQQRRLAAAGRAVPASLAIPALLRQLERVATRAGVSLDAVAQGGGAATSTSPDSAAAGAAGVDATGITLKLEGRYRNVRRFLTRLDNLVRVSGETIEGTGRLISISSIGVAPGPSRRLVVAVETTVYTLQDAATVAAAAATAAGTATTPAPGSGGSAPVAPAAVGAGG